MSFHRENIVWQSLGGTWNRGFFTVSHIDSGPDADPEWDVEYDMNSFSWVSTGHRTAEAAWDSWNGANPGGGWEVTRAEKTAEECDGYDAMAKRYVEEQRKHDEALRRAPRYPGYWASPLYPR